MSAGPKVSVNVLSTGHPALDHRLFDKEGRALARAGYDVRIFARHPRAETVEGVELVPLDQGSGRLERFVVAPWRALAAARRRPAPIVHIHDAELLQICPVLKLLGQPVIVYDCHEDFPNLMRRRDWIPGPLREPVRIVVTACERLLARAVDAVVAPTQTLADKFPRRRLALYNLPSHAFIERAGDQAVAPAERGWDLVHLGVLSEERMEFLARVIESLRERRPALRFRIVGVTGAQVDRLRERFAGADCDIRGKVPYGEVHELLRECRIGINVHPYLHPHIRAAVPVKVLEYMACGCGVVTSWLPELDGLLDGPPRDQATILRSTDPREYAAAVADLLDDPVRLEQSAAALRQATLTSLHWEAEATKLTALYGELLNGRAPR